MQCSICNGTLYSATFKGAKFKYCKTCNSVFIETEELKKALSSCGGDKAVEYISNVNEALIGEETRNCSVCGNKMEKIIFDDVVLDRCKQCKIIVFEEGELSKFFSKYTENKEICSNSQFITKYFREKVEETEVQDNSGSEGKAEYMQNYTGNGAKSTQETRTPNINGFLAIILILVLSIPLIVLCLLSPIISSFVLPIAIGLLIFIVKGFRTVKPQEAVAYTLFGRYYGSIKTPGFYWVNPFASPVGMIGATAISLKVRTLDSGAQKINDELGNPIQVGIIVTWQVVDTAKALFDVDDYVGFLSSQSDTALRSIIRQYPYDAPSDSNVHSLRGDSEEISEKLKVEIQKNVAFAGIKIIGARISHLAYAPEIAAAMLQRQQANAILDAKKAIVDGSVDMVTMALDKLASSNVNLDEKTKANMVNNLLVALCSNKDNQPVTRLDVI